MLKEKLEAHNLPALLSREEMVEVLQREEYGYLPDVEWGIISVMECIFYRIAIGNFICSILININNKSRAKLNI